MQLNDWSKDLSVEVAGHGVVSHAGSAVLRLLADNSGLTSALSTALARRGLGYSQGKPKIRHELAIPIVSTGESLGTFASLTASSGARAHYDRRYAPGGADPVAQVVFHRGRREVQALLWDRSDLVTKRVASPAQLGALDKAMAARRWCPSHPVRVDGSAVSARRGEDDLAWSRSVDFALSLVDAETTQVVDGRAEVGGRLGLPRRGRLVEAVLSGVLKATQVAGLDEALR